MAFTKSIFVSLTKEEELKPARNSDGSEKKRIYLFVQDHSNFEFYLNPGTHADSNNGTTVGAGLYYERERTVPQGTIFVKGSQAADQRLSVEEEFA